MSRRSAARATTLAASARLVVLLAGLALAGCAVLPGGKPPPIILVKTTAAEETEAVRLVSQYRRAHGLGAVAFDPILERAAEAQARAVAEAGELFHGDFLRRMTQFGDPSVAAENLAGGTVSVGDTMDLWKASPGHNANLLRAGVNRIGLAHVDTPGAGLKTYWALVLTD